jgi:serine protease inhibitor
MRRFTALIVRRAALTLFLAGAHAQQPAADYSPIVDANTRFGLKIVRTSAARLTKNEIVSPIALSSGFALLRNGANQQCAKEIGDTFEFGQIPEESANKAYAALMGELLSRPPDIDSSSGTTHPRNAGTGSKPYGLYLANSFWDIGGPADFYQSFRDVNEHYYRAQVASLRHSRGAVTAINRWAAEKSFGMTPQIVTSIADNDFLFTSLLYFRSYWKDVFLSSNTYQAEFTLLSGTTKPVQMMKQSGDYRYEQTPDFEAIVLPYSDGRELYIFLPDKTSSLRDFEATLTGENWNKWTETMTSRPGTIELPKFRISSKVEVQPLLTELGARCAFTSLQAFNRAVREGAKLTRAEQSSSLAADELGSEAVVYTGVGGVVGGVPGALLGYKPPPPFHMIVNRPFLTAIIDARTRAMVLLSSVVEP